MAAPRRRYQNTPLNVSIADNDARFIELATMPNQNSAAIEGYSVLLQAVEPYPQSAKPNTPEEEYTITIVISRQ